MQDYIDDGKLAGISALVYKNGEIVYRKNFGVADLTANESLGDSTIFRIFSMTKPVTAAALMTLYDEGKFKLDDKVSKFLPEFEGAKVYNPETKTTEPQENEMTIRHLLTHTSGIPYGWDQTSYVDSLYRVKGGSGWDGVLGEKMKIIADIPLKHQPGTVWDYGLGIDLAGYLIEVISGMPLDEFFKTRIFDPLNMDDTGFYVPREKHQRLSALFAIGKDKKLTTNDGMMSEIFKQPVTLFSGGGGLVSTIDDYLKFSKMLLNGGELDGVRILEESTAEMILSDQLPETATYRGNTGYGLAGSVNLTDGTYGWAGAASTKFWIDQKNEMIVMAFAQLMPGDYTFADEFKAAVDSALIQ
jgi:CubicO group peptidase (beta-lactamase class C family)